MNILEKILDKITPKLEVLKEVRINFEESEFPENLISVIENDKYKVIDQSKKKILILVSGLTIGAVDFGALLKNNPSFEKLNKVKSKISISINKGSLLCCSFEHIIATKKEKEVFTEILQKRLDFIIDRINDY
ncbi:MAG: hypothetical protein GQ574_25340 [Crocinitomix sp.]|nr:hypothetical protein [Crocinitomix sp.]